MISYVKSEPTRNDDDPRQSQYWKSATYTRPTLFSNTLPKPVNIKHLYNIFTMFYVCLVGAID